MAALILACDEAYILSRTLGAASGPRAASPQLRGGTSVSRLIVVVAAFTERGRGDSKPVAGNAVSGAALGAVGVGAVGAPTPVRWAPRGGIDEGA
jgi:hypothetical protein